ncbi:MAG: phosphatase PAP2 family protein [Gemmatimonadetes bacterium]|nr:phosphatase PAP2 family protein [Gemmatimonadota bacterium]
MRKLLVLLWTIALLPVLPLAAQGPDSTRTARDRLFRRGDALFAAGFVLGTAALAPADRYLAHRIQDSTFQAVAKLHRAATAIETLGRPGALVISGAMFLTGKLTGYDGMAHVGLSGAEALIAAEVLTRGIKGVAGRGRPYVDIDDPYNFHFGRGYGNQARASFPSGHAAHAFAAAAVFTAETARSSQPGLRWVVGPVLYGGATLVGISRMYDNKHWASDILAGAAVGTFTGLTVVRARHRAPVRDASGSPAPAVRIGINGHGRPFVSLAP